MKKIFLFLSLALSLSANAQNKKKLFYFVPFVNSGYPSATLTMGASSGTYAIKGITKAIITKL